MTTATLEPSAKATPVHSHAEIADLNATLEDFLDGEVFLPVFTSNIGRHVSQAKARANIAKVFNQGWMTSPWSHAKILGLKGFQEIDEADTAQEHQIVSSLVRKGNITPWAEHQVLLDSQIKRGAPLYGFGGFAQATPIAVPAPWTIEDVKVDLTVKGKAKVSPHRVCVQVEMSHPGLDHNLWALCGHYPYKWPEGWKECHTSWQQIARRHQTLGHPMVTMRDVNEHGRLPKLVASEVQCVTGGIDKVSFIESDAMRITRARGRSARKSVNLTIDGHDLQGAGLVLAAA